MQHMSLYRMAEHAKTSKSNTFWSTTDLPNNEYAEVTKHKSHMQWPKGLQFHRDSQPKSMWIILKIFEESPNLQIY